MDFLRPRAVPALIALAAALAPWAAAAATGCAALDGVYEDRAVALRQGMSEHLTNLVDGPQKAQLFRREGQGPKSLAPSGPMARPKITHLAATAKLAWNPAGTKLTFMDAEGKALATLGIDASGRWTCRAGRLERRSTRTAGLGDVLRTERVEEVLERDAKGDLVYSETVTVVEPPGGKPKRSEARFRLARAPA